MTKEETLAYVKAYLDGDTAVGNIIHLRSVLEFVVKYLSQPSLPSNLDEAAREYLRQYNESEFGNGGDDWDDDIYITFKAGAEWMAGQGETFEITVSNVGFLQLPELNINAGDKVVVQIRKKQ